MSLTEYPKRYCPACDSLVGKDFIPGPGGRPNAGCPVCGSLERHRFLALLLACLQPTLGTLDLLLDIAPTPPVTPLLKRLGAKHLVRLDLGADNRLVDMLGSLTNLPFANSSVDLLMCYHVLEHVPDDRAAMREIARVLRPGGLALLQVPWNPGHPTDEDPSAPVSERLKRFGQADHVRFYGDDFEDRLIEAGLSLRRVTPRSLLGEQMCTWFNLAPDETVWLATASADRAPAVPAASTGTSMTVALDALAGQLDEVAGQLAAARARSAAEQARRLVRRVGRSAPQGVRKSKLARSVRRRLRG